MFSLVEKEEIRLKYQYNINQIIPDLLYENKLYNRVIVSIIHSNKDLNFNCLDREILYTLKEFLGEEWQFRESHWGKCLQCNFQFIKPTVPSFQNIFPIYKKFYIKRMNLIFQQYDKIFIKDGDLQDKLYQYSEFESDYNKIKADVFNLKKQLNNKILKILIYKIHNLSEDIYNIILNFAINGFEEYFIIREKMEKLRSKIRQNTE
jgi:hypothetical protein